MAETWTTADTVAGHLAMWAIRQSPYVCPDNLDRAVIDFLNTFPADDAGLSQWVSMEALEDAVWQSIEHSPAIKAWNVPKSGHDAPFVFSSRYDRPSPDDDFIDLHALKANVARSVWAEEEATA